MHVLTDRHCSFALAGAFSQVKGGGHASNPGFSSTEGVQIAMYRFSEVKYNPDNQTAEVGSGLIWDEVYTALEPYAVNVVGGRVTGVGMAGFTLGGGEYCSARVFFASYMGAVVCLRVRGHGGRRRREGGRRGEWKRKRS